jgi:hypothetical protein
LETTGLRHVWVNKLTGGVVMATIEDASAFAKARGYDFSTGTDGQQALAKAGDYIRANYRLRAPKNADEQALLDDATYLLAIEFYSNDAPALRAAQQVKEAKKQIGTLLTDTTYFDAPADLYPAVSGMLAPLNIANQKLRFGRMVRP